MTDGSDVGADSRPTAITVDRWTGRLFALAVAATVLPVWVAAWRVAASGFYPTSDAALTVMRAHDVFTRHPPLVGMPAASGAFGDSITHFPGPIQLYVLAGPVELFGNVWGPPIAMGLLSTIWILATSWVLRRVLGPRMALIGVAFLGVFAWSIGIGYLVDPVPVTMLIFAFLPFLMSAWCAATGDRVALVVTAVMANYLWLDHLALVVMAPVVAAGALVGYVSAHRQRLWGRAEEHRSHEHRAARRRAWQGLAAAAVVTVVMWIPTLIAEATRSPGNLRMLTRSSGHEREVVASFSFALHVLVDLMTYPPFWLRGSFDDPPYVNAPKLAVTDGSSTGYAIVMGLVLVGLFVWLGVLARRKGDRVALWALIMAVVAVAAAVPTIYFTPTQFGISGYLRPLWGVAGFVWCALVYATIRLVWRPRHTWAVWAVAAVTVLVGVANLPTSKRGYVPEPRTTAMISEVNEAVLAEVADGGPIAVMTRPDYATQEFFGALVLAFRTAGLDFCVSIGSPPLAGVPACDDQDRQVIAIAVTDDATPSVRAAPETIVAVPFLTPEERERVDALEERVTDWLSSGESIRLTAAAQRELDASGPETKDYLAELITPSNDAATLERRNYILDALVALWVANPDQGDEPLFVGAPLSLSELHEWHELSGDRRDVIVTAQGRTGG
ncbi:MAG TPA: hypothetical protein VFN21_04725 [Acidimicrobiales bacterium]|nr:hypothetical protein [Acidimicrobiales bacterium]